jgi:hypothetical protein
MKRIAFLSILFAALIEFAIERAKFDLARRTFVLMHVYSVPTVTTAI